MLATCCLASQDYPPTPHTPTTTTTTTPPTRSGTSSGRSVVVCAPTGAGKTAIAEAAALHYLDQGQRVIYTTPLKALSNQKLQELRGRFGWVTFCWNFGVVAIPWFTRNQRLQGLRGRWLVGYGARFWSFVISEFASNQTVGPEGIFERVRSRVDLWGGRCAPQ